MSANGVTRRQLLRRSAQGGAAVAALGAAGFAGYKIGDDQVEQAPAAAPGPSAAPAPPAGNTAAQAGEVGVEAFVSRPDLQPPRLDVSRPAGSTAAPESPACLFLAPKGYPVEGPGQQGAMIAASDGRLVWFAPREEGVAMDFKAQTYRGEPVLTWWEGAIIPDGHGEGRGLVFDKSYRQIATVRAAKGLKADLHEFLLTDRDTALLMIYEAVQADLTRFGGEADGWVYDNVVQEIEVESGKLLFEWRGLDHVPLEETQATLEGPQGTQGSRKAPFDYLHLNSIAVAPDGDLVISARNTWAVYKLAAGKGDVVWRLGGSASDFELDSDAVFYWQHDARLLDGGRLSLFDNAAAPPKADQSRGLVLSVDEGSRRVSVERQYLHPARLLAPNQGSMQVLADDWVAVGWGAQAYVSFFGPDGELALDARLPAGDQSYRGYAFDWEGEPSEPPKVAVGPNAPGGATVYASWNGATKVRSWRVLAGKKAKALESLATVPKTGFETAIAVESEGPFFAVVALDAEGNELGEAEAVKLEPPAEGG